MKRTFAIPSHELERLLPLYRRWEQEGRPPFRYDSYDNPPRKAQYYYDAYHDCIRKNDDGTYRFDIQAFDSPEGDTWVHGTFRLEDGRVTIIEQSAYTN